MLIYVYTGCAVAATDRKMCSSDAAGVQLAGLCCTSLNACTFDELKKVITMKSMDIRYFTPLTSIVTFIFENGRAR